MTRDLTTPGSAPKMSLSHSAASRIDWEGLRNAVGNLVDMSPARSESAPDIERITAAFRDSKVLLEPQIHSLRRVQQGFLWLAFGALALALIGGAVAVVTPHTVTGAVLFGGSEAAFCGFFFKVLQFARDGERLNQFLAHYEIAFRASATSEQHDFVLKRFIEALGHLRPGSQTRRTTTLAKKTSGKADTAARSPD